MKRPATDAPNVLLIVTDTMRVDALGLGTTGGVAPALSAAAAGGRIYRKATSASPWTSPSHASMFTGLAPSEHGLWGPNLLDDRGWPRRGILKGPILDRWLPSILAERGYHTVGISANAWISEYLGFDHGFDRYLTIRDNPAGKRGPSWTGRLASLAPERAGRSLRRRRLMANIQHRGQDWGAERVLSTIGGYIGDTRRPYFAFLNFMEPHWPYHPSPGFEGFSRDEARLAVEVLLQHRNPVHLDNHGRIAYHGLTPERLGMLRALYRGEVSYLDRRLGELLERFDDSGWLRDTVVIVVADHGEHLGEHGMFRHIGSIYEELLHVPLVVLGPADLVGRGVEDTRVSTQNLYGAMLDWTRGESASLLGRGSVIAEYEGPWSHSGALRRMSRKAVDPSAKATIWAIYDDDLKFARDATGREWVYDLAADPGETKPLSTDGRQDRLRHRLAGSLASRSPSLLGPGSARERDLEVERELRTLGYL